MREGSSRVGKTRSRGQVVVMRVAGNRVTTRQSFSQNTGAAVRLQVKGEGSVSMYGGDRRCR